MTMRLYGVKGYGSAIAEAMLALAGQEYAFIDVEGFDRPGRPREVLQAVNPLAQVPVLLLEDGLTMTETAAITLHLADRFPGLEPPPGSAARSRFYRLLIWLVANVYPTFTYGDYPERWVPAAPGELVAATDRYRERLYLWLEEQVAGDFVLQEGFSALDIYLAVLVAWKPGQEWFRSNTPKLLAAAEAARRMPPVAGVLARNGLR